MCHWVCLVGTTWACDPDQGCTCPEEEACLPPTQSGASGDKATTPCLPIGTNSGPGGGD